MEQEKLPLVRVPGLPDFEEPLHLVRQALSERHSAAAAHHVHLGEGGGESHNLSDKKIK